MKNFNQQPFHIVTLSPWPLLTSMAIMVFLAGFVNMMNFKDYFIMMMGMFFIITCLFQWWQNIFSESGFQGNHTPFVKKGIKIGMILFIISEVLFFFSFFWSYLHMLASPNIELGSMWPPKMIDIINPINLPLLNTILLVSSGISLSSAHYNMIKSQSFKFNLMMILTLTFSMIFTSIQIYEYMNMPFKFNDSIYGSTFFTMTGFHGIHVIIGTIYLIVSFISVKKTFISNKHHMGFEASAWYWHFVDVVWLFLFLLVYWWPY